MTHRPWLLGAAAFMVACAPELEDQPYLIERARLLAVLAEPPEARPGGGVVLTPVVASRRPRSSDFSYYFCTQAPAPADPRPSSEACLEEAGLPLVVAGTTAQGRVPADTCARFGPDPVGASFRPHDADGTGGFYQPIVVRGLGQTSLARLRILCPLPDVPIDLARAYQQQYVPNRNPEGLRFERESNGNWEAFTTSDAGERTLIRVVWDDSTRQDYVWLPPDASALEQRKEALRVAWFVTGGSFGEATTGRSEADARNDSRNTFVAPDRAGPQQLWAVVHDSRGGTAVLSQMLEIRER